MFPLTLDKMRKLNFK